MQMPASAALWLLPFAAPICLYVAWTDLAQMKIRNHAVLALVAVYAVVGLFVLPPGDWAWRWTHLAVVLVIGFALNMGGLLGAGDAKFAAAAAPFVALGDARLVIVLVAAMLFAALVVHRLVRATPPLRNLAPSWQSWQEDERFPMGLALGPALAAYLALGAVYGA